MTDWNPADHPRGPDGQFIDSLGNAFTKGSKVNDQYGRSWTVTGTSWVVEVRIPKGTRALVGEPDPKVESEVLLPLDVRMRVVSDGTSGGLRRVVVEVVG